MRVTVILVRHGHVEGIDQPRFRGQMHLQLTAVGLQQAEQACQYIQRAISRPTRIYSSPLTRCITTASIIGGPFGLAPIPEQGLIDIDYGAWQGRLVSEVSEESAALVSEWFKVPGRVEIPGGETLRALSDRVGDAMARILKENPGDPIVVVGHDSVNRVLLLQALGLPLDRYWNLGQRPGAINRLEYDKGDWSVESLNETAHLIPVMGHNQQ